MTNLKTGKLKLTAFQIFIASGSGISDPKANSGYEPALVEEMHRVCHVGGNTIEVNAEGAADLSEWAADLSGAVAQEPNPSGARSLFKLHRQAYDLAKELKA
jgi:hypothetical protein